MLRPSEWGLYRAHLLRLGADDRRLRFGCTLHNNGVVAFVDGLDPVRDQILVCQDRDGAVIGAVLIARHRGRDIELGFSVDAGWRGRGLGLALGRRALIRARNRGIRRAAVLCLAENQAMRRLARGLGMTLAIDGAECEGLVTLAPATPLSLLQEWAAEQAALCDHAARSRRRRAAALCQLRPAT